MMKRCSVCNKRIAIGGIEVGDQIYCDEKCQKKGLLNACEELVSEEMVKKHIDMHHEGLCPKCGSKGPNDLQTHYKIWSVILLTSHQEIPEICCRSCGVKKKLSGLVFSFLFGWWGFPVGILLTPILIILNFIGLFRLPKEGKPSKKLEEFVRMDLGAKAILFVHENGKVPTKTLLS